MAQCNDEAPLQHPCLRLGNCQFGETCVFARLPRQACVFFLKGRCRYGGDCQDLHLGPDALGGDSFGDLVGGPWRMQFQPTEARQLQDDPLRPFERMPLDIAQEDHLRSLRKELGSREVKGSISRCPFQQAEPNSALANDRALPQSMVPASGTTATDAANDLLSERAHKSRRKRSAPQPADEVQTWVLYQATTREGRPGLRMELRLHETEALQLVHELTAQQVKRASPSQQQQHQRQPQPPADMLGTTASADHPPFNQPSPPQQHQSQHVGNFAVPASVVLPPFDEAAVRADERARVLEELHLAGYDTPGRSGKAQAKRGRSKADRRGQDEVDVGPRTRSGGPQPGPPDRPTPRIAKGGPAKKEGAQGKRRTHHGS